MTLRSASGHWKCLNHVGKQRSLCIRRSIFPWGLHWNLFVSIVPVHFIMRANCAYFFSLFHFKTFILSELVKLDNKYRAEICGSFRRGRLILVVQLILYVLALWLFTYLFFYFMIFLSVNLFFQIFEKQSVWLSSHVVKDNFRFLCLKLFTKETDFLSVTFNLETTVYLSS